MEADEAKWPLVVVDVHRQLQTGEIDTLLEVMGKWIERGEHVIVVHSHTPNSLGRDGILRMRQWQDAHKAAFESTCRGMGMVADHMGPVRRLAMSTMMALLGNMSVPVTFHGSRGAATVWARRQVARENAPTS